MLLNKNAYEIKPGGLIYDGSHPADGTAVTVTFASAAAADGKVAEGQVIDIDTENDAYVLHASGGTVYGVVSEDTEFESGATSVVCPVYISGSIRESKLVTDAVLTAEDIEAFRGKGIFLK